MLKEINEQEAKVTFLCGRRLWASNGVYRWAFERGMTFNENKKAAQKELGKSIVYYRVKSE